MARPPKLQIEDTTGALFSVEVLSPKGATPLAELRTRVNSCVSCPQHLQRQHVLFGEGCADSPSLMFIGEGPTAAEDLQGKLHVGPAGHMITKIIEALGYTRNQVYCCNVVCCRLGRTVSPISIEYCRPYLLGQIHLIKPAVIITLGATAAYALIRTKKSFDKLLGKWSYIDGIPIISTLHPNTVLQSEDAKARRFMWDHMKAAKEKVNELRRM